MNWKKTQYNSTPYFRAALKKLALVNPELIPFVIIS